MTRLMPFSLQSSVIKASLARAGIDPELFDVSANIDRTLRLHENLPNILSMHGIRKRRDYSQERSEESRRERAARSDRLRQTGVSNETIDRRFMALLPGRRVSGAGHTYYERRTNRSDRDRQRRL